MNRRLLFPLVLAILLLFFFSSSLADEPFIFDGIYYREGRGIYIDTVASPVVVRGQQLRFRWGYDEEHVSIPYKFAQMPFWIEHDLPFVVDLCDGRLTFNTTFPTSTFIDWDYNVFEPNYRSEMIDEPCAEPFDRDNCFIDRDGSYEFVFCDGGIRQNVCSHTVQVPDGTFTTITRSHPVALTELESCPLERNRRYNLYHYAEIPLGEQTVFDVSLELSLPTLDRAVFVIPAPSWTSTTANDYNSGNAWDFNWTKVTWDGNVMPTGDDRIHNDNNQLFYDKNLVAYWRFNDLNASGQLFNDTNQTVFSTMLGSASINKRGMWDSNALNIQDSGNCVDTNFTGNDLNELTMILWTKLEYVVGVRYFLDNSNGTAGFGFRHNSKTLDCFVVSGGATGLVSASGTMDANAWMHLSCVHSSTSNVIYKDGIALNTTPYNAGSGIDDSASTMNIGAAFPVGCDSGIIGQIDEVKIYDRALSAAEIVADYNSWMHSSYLSPVKDAGAAVNWDAMDWNAFVDVNNSVTVDYRGCSTDDCSTAGAWQENLRGSPPGTWWTDIRADGNRYFQYRVNFDTNRQRWNRLIMPLVATDTSKFGHISNVVVVYSAIAGEDSCSCPASGNWNIVDGDVCTLSTACNLSGGSLHIFNGSLTITSTGTLNVPTGYKIIIEKVDAKLVLEKQGKIIVNK